MLIVNKPRSHQDELGISDEQAQSIIADIRDIHHDHEDDLLSCPHCHKPLRFEVSQPGE